MDLEALDLERRPGRAPDPDGVDPDATVRRGLGSLERIGRLVVLAVGQQDDRGRGVRAVRDGRRGGRGRDPASGWCRSPRPGPRRRCRSSSARSRCRAPIDVPRSGASRSIAARTRAWSSVGTWIEKPLSLKATTPIRIEAGWRSTKARAAALAASIRVGCEVVGGHAARDVEREDHRALDPRHADDALRPSEGQDQDRQPDDEEHRREPAPEAADRASDRSVPAPAKAPNSATAVAAGVRARGRAATPSGIARTSSSIGGQMNDIATVAAAAGASPSGRSPRRGPRRSRARPRRRRIA